MTLSSDSQRERIELIKMALQAKLGTDSAKSHYGLGEDTEAIRNQAERMEARSESREPQSIRMMLGGMEGEDAPPSVGDQTGSEDGAARDDEGLHL